MCIWGEEGERMSQYQTPFLPKKHLTNWGIGCRNIADFMQKPTKNAQINRTIVQRMMDTFFMDIFKSYQFNKKVQVVGTCSFTIFKMIFAGNRIDATIFCTCKPIIGNQCRHEIRYLEQKKRYRPRVCAKLLGFTPSFQRCITRRGLLFEIFDLGVFHPPKIYFFIWLENQIFFLK